MRRYWLSLLLLLTTLAACSEVAPERAAVAPSTGLRLLGGEAGDSFARATTPREFVFPADHGSHSEYRTEWWYFTGNLTTASGRHFGFELTFFRYALAPAPEANGPDAVSAWRTNEIWMAHFAITDTASGRFIARERLARRALELAGATPDPLRVWVKDWSASGSSANGSLTLRLDARDDGVAIALNLLSTVPYVAHGDEGLDAKGALAGNASYYYSVPRLEADGTVTVDGETFEVTGLAWLDREWSTSALEPGVVGWDWFALHLSDASSLMFYRLRTASGEAAPFSGGTLVGADGGRVRLEARDVALTPRKHWTSPATGVRYPVAWRLVAPKVGITLDVEPYLENQELALSVRYWEGAVRAQGQGPAGPLSAQGYLELAGY
jgi:predicted secreted hydrolase